MLRSQSQELSQLRTDLDAANQAIGTLRNQIMAIEAAYQVRDAMRQEADNVSSQRMQILDAASSDWADGVLPSDIGGMFSGKTGAAGSSGNTTGESVSGNAGATVDASNK